MLILYLHNAQRYILLILMLQITHRDAVAFLVWTDLIRKMRDIYIHICLFVCLSFTHNLFYFVFSICLSKIYSLYFCSKTNQTSISWNIGIYINQTKTLNYNYLWITKKPKTPQEHLSFEPLQWIRMLEWVTYICFFFNWYSQDTRWKCSLSVMDLSLHICLIPTWRRVYPSFHRK